MKKIFLLFLPLMLVGCSSSENTSSNDTSSAGNTTTSSNQTTSSNTSIATEFNVNGNVYLLKDNSEMPLKDVVFKLENETNKYLSTSSDEQGQFSFTNVKNGNYSFSIYIAPFTIKDFSSYEILINKDATIQKTVVELLNANWTKLV